MYACRTPLSSELKKPRLPSGERNGWIWLSFAHVQAAFTRHRQFERGERSSSGISATKTCPPLSQGPASVMKRLPAMSVAKCEKSGLSKVFDKSVRLAPDAFAPEWPECGAGRPRSRPLWPLDFTDVEVIADVRRPIQHWCPWQNSSPLRPQGCRAGRRCRRG